MPGTSQEAVVTEMCKTLLFLFTTASTFFSVIKAERELGQKYDPSRRESENTHLKNTLESSSI